MSIDAIKIGKETIFIDNESGTVSLDYKKLRCNYYVLSELLQKDNEEAIRLLVKRFDDISKEDRVYMLNKINEEDVDIYLGLYKDSGDLDITVRLGEHIVTLYSDREDIWLYGSKSMDKLINIKDIEIIEDNAVTFYKTDISRGSFNAIQAILKKEGIYV